jgi:hypothetical protein
MLLFIIWGSHSGGYEENYIVGYNAVQSIEKSTDVSEEHIASIFRTKEQANKDTSVTAKGGDMFLRNVGWLSTGYTALYVIFLFVVLLERNSCYIINPNVCVPLLPPPL